MHKSTTNSSVVVDDGSTIFFVIVGYFYAFVSSNSSPHSIVSFYDYDCYCPTRHSLSLHTPRLPLALILNAFNSSLRLGLLRVFCIDSDLFCAMIGAKLSMLLFMTDFSFSFLCSRFFSSRRSVAYYNISLLHSTNRLYIPGHFSLALSYIEWNRKNREDKSGWWGFLLGCFAADDVDIVFVLKCEPTVPNIKWNVRHIHPHTQALKYTFKCATDECVT